MSFILKEKDYNIIDLTHPIYNNSPTYPSDPSVEVIKVKSVEKNSSTVHSLQMGTHTGTHLDVPSHIIPNGKTIGDFSLEKFSGKVIKVNSASVDNYLNSQVKVDGIIYETGWHKKFSNPKIFFGSDRPQIPLELIEESVKRRYKFFGCDIPSVDVSGSKTKPLHNTLLGNDIIIYESLANLNLLPLMEIFNFQGLPLALNELDGSPVRAVGVLK